MSGQERRQQKRVKGDVAVAINDTESNIISEARDISVSGVCCKTNKVLSEMSKVVITLLLPLTDAKGKKTITKINCQGVVVRHEPIKDEPGSYWMAVFFADLGKNEKKALEKYVEHVSSKSASDDE